MSRSNQCLLAWLGIMVAQELDLALQRCLADRLVDRGPAEVAVPFRDLVFQDQMIAEGVPGQPAHLAVILMPVVTRVGQDQVRARQRLETFEPLLDRRALPGEMPIAERLDIDVGRGRTLEERGGAGLRLGRPRRRGADRRTRRPRRRRPSRSGREWSPRSRSRCRRSARRGTGGATARPCARGTAASCLGLLRGPGQPGRPALFHHVLEQSACRAACPSRPRSRGAGRRPARPASISRWNGSTTSSSPGRMNSKMRGRKMK